MALADLMKKGFLTSATATPATPATHGTSYRPTVATVAGVAVAKPTNAKITSTQAPANDGAGLRQTSTTTQSHRQLNSDTLALFRFDLVQRDIEDGYPAEELTRVNNMAWEFMRVDGMGFDEAIRAAAEIVAHTQIAACEAAYADVMVMFSKYKEGKTHHAKD